MILPSKRHFELKIPMFNIKPLIFHKIGSKVSKEEAETEEFLSSVDKIMARKLKTKRLFSCGAIKLTFSFSSLFSRDSHE